MILSKAGQGVRVKHSAENTISNEVLPPCWCEQESTNESDVRLGVPSRYDVSATML